MSIHIQSQPWRTRFAPSPTGLLHLGNARTAVLNALIARKTGGAFFLRLEDTDQERSTFGFMAELLHALHWLGIEPDQAPWQQSLRLCEYQSRAKTLRDQDLAYPCFCTQDMLEEEVQQAKRSGQPPRYSGRCARLSPAEREKQLQAGTPHTIRFRNTADAEIVFHDLLKGEVRIPATAFGDFVLMRSNGWPSYSFAVVVDDSDMGITLVLRGEDHLSNTARQILLYQALQSPLPQFAHHGLLVDSDGKKLSKRNGAPNIQDCMTAGLAPLAICHELAGLGGALSPKALFSSLADMAEAFHPHALGRGNAVLSMQSLKQTSTRYFRNAPLTPEIFAEANPASELSAETQTQLLECLRKNVSCVSELKKWMQLLLNQACYSMPTLEHIRPATELLTLLHARFTALPADFSLQRAELSSIFAELSAATGRKGKALYHPLRLALTGRTDGPELAELLTIMPCAWTSTRLGDLLTILTHDLSPKE